MFKLETKPVEYVACGHDEIVRGIEENNIDMFPRSIQFLIQSGKLKLSNGNDGNKILQRRYVRCNDSGGDRYQTIDQGQYFVCTKDGPCSIHTMDEIKAQFHIIDIVGNGSVND